MNDLEKLLKEIIQNVNKLKTLVYPEFQLKIGYLTIFSHSKEQYESLCNLLKKIGSESKTNNGNRYDLVKPLNISETTVRSIRIRRPDIHRFELGCCDLEYDENDYLKIRNLALEKGLDIILRKDYEMIELSTFDLPVYAYILKDF